MPPTPPMPPVAIHANNVPPPNPPVTNEEIYTESQVQVLEALATETEGLFPIGKVYGSHLALREELRLFAHKKGFVVSSIGSKFLCTRAETPQSYRRKKERKPPVPAEKKRMRKTTRVGCCFQISFSPVSPKEYKTNKSVSITKSSKYSHTHGCFPCRNQLVVEKRKAGTITVAIHETQIKAILAVMSSGERVPTAMMRQLMKPIYPEGTSLDAVLVFNFRLKIKRMLSSGVVDLESHTVTETEERNLLSSEEADFSSSPDYLTEAFVQFQDLLKEALSDENDVKQITTYLESLAGCDPSFTFRIGRSADGSVTGFVWQTGVMRRDFELYGDVLFLDAQGRSLNDKGWPINTIAMLDGQRKVCLPCEGITITESIDSYAWLIRSTASMAPGRKLSEIKVMFGDGIFSGESLLPSLGISRSCRFILDHHHLLSEDIGAWPKEFGLQLFALLKADLTTMVKSETQEAYEQSLARVRQKVSSNVVLSEYVESNIHCKRHLFANHIIRTYHGNLNLHGNAPAESNHSSIVTRIGSLVVTPVELVRALVKRHRDVCSERHLGLQTYHYHSMADALKHTDASKGLALKALSKWGYELFGRAVYHSTTIGHTVSSTGEHVFTDGVVLPQNSKHCLCRQWIATPGTQCKHLILAFNGFTREAWSPRWLQRPELGTSNLTAAEVDDVAGGDDDDDGGTGMGDDDDDDASVAEEAPPPGNSAGSEVDRSSLNLGMRDLMDATRALAISVDKVRDKAKKRLLVGAVLKLTEIAKGNLEEISAQSLEEVLENQFGLFTRNMASQPMFSQEDSSNKENEVMRNAAPKGTSGGARQRSANERTMNSMRNSTRRPEICTLCYGPGHRVGTHCTVVNHHQAVVVPPKEVPLFAGRLGNPVAVKVEMPDAETKANIREWLSAQPSIPAETHHMVVKRCFYPARRNETVTNYVVEVHLLKETGESLEGYCPSYFFVHQVSFWITQNCCTRGRKKHLLSCLTDAPLALSQDLCNYSP